MGDLCGLGLSGTTTTTKMHAVDGGSLYGQRGLLVFAPYLLFFSRLLSCVSFHVCCVITEWLGCEVGRGGVVLFPR